MEDRVADCYSQRIDTATDYTGNLTSCVSNGWAYTLLLWGQDLDIYFYKAERIILKREVMKTEIIKIANFMCMFIVLGTQALLHGSWKMPKTATVRGNREGIKGM
ncbi:Hypothetical protein ZOBELLIA_1481 [Zobellia galactanivorans]|uniref:Uncharacterized protein n=1 Tax=Zobellia galactanivorans (strain DSM 12802 / CCUG 47099 / CIP 106680 / NCIMB 13871 / Dsij) TaxID=63186 RepID=G0L3X1_ZOBGA|nr:Hypothetical protein ZOBELLIA_1481 [Zobellia galactanivorans]